MDMNKEYLNFTLKNIPERITGQWLRKLPAKQRKIQIPPAFLIGTSDAAADGEEILRGIEEVAGAGVNAFGGAGRR